MIDFLSESEGMFFLLIPIMVMQRTGARGTNVENYVKMYVYLCDDVTVHTSFWYY